MKRSKGMQLGAMLLIFLVSASVPVSAYYYSGYRWLGASASYNWDSSTPSDWHSSVNNAANTWSNAGSQFRFSESSSSLNKIYKGSLGSSGPIAQTATNSLLSKLIYASITFNSDYTWSTSGQSGSFDVQNTATHEFGHWLQLGDLSCGYDSEKTMYAYESTGETKKRSLETDDIDGIKYIYGV
ncbi:Matrixin [uncultured archaeon]|nr:Matrixin [uncultured archaeon]